MLTSAQKAALKTDIQNDTTLNGYWTDGNPSLIADAYNTVGTFVVWRTNIPAKEYRETIDWTECDTLTAGKARIWEWITMNMTSVLDASKTNVRAGLAEVWASNSNTRPAMLAIAHRLCNRVEKLFATGTGTEASPATMSYEGNITWFDVVEAMRS